MLETELKANTAAVTENNKLLAALIERLATNNQSDAYRQAKAIEAEPEVAAQATKTEEPQSVEAANDESYSTSKAGELATSWAKLDRAELLDTLKNEFGDGMTIGKMDAEQRKKFGKMATARLAEAS